MVSSAKVTASLSFVVSLTIAFVALSFFVGTGLARSSRANRNGNGFIFFKRSASLDKSSQDVDQWNLPRQRSPDRLESTYDRGNNQGDLRLNLAGVRLANLHLVKIHANYRCGNPRPRLVRVKDYHISAEKIYLPRCTVLHKCDDESGCCANDAYHCVAKTSVPVELYFHVVVARNSSIEMLTFTNDTECECREVNYQPRVLQESDMVQTTALSTTTRSKSGEGLMMISLPPPPSVTSPRALSALNDRDDEALDTEAEEGPGVADLQLNKGKEILCGHVDCPNPFKAVPITKYWPVRKCKCDCHRDDKVCIRIKRGLARLSMAEARCVVSTDCLEPTCDHGAYDKTKRMCPAESGSDGHRKHHLRHQKHYLHERD